MDIIANSCRKLNKDPWKKRVFSKCFQGKANICILFPQNVVYCTKYERSRDVHFDWCVMCYGTCDRWLQPIKACAETGGEFRGGETGSPFGTPGVRVFLSFFAPCGRNNLKTQPARGRKTHSGRTPGEAARPSI